MTKKILILDFGSQYTQLIARKVREQKVYCEIVPYHYGGSLEEVKGIILSGSPASVNEVDAPLTNIDRYQSQLPLLGICYGAQLIAKQYGGEVAKAASREYGRAKLILQQNESPLFMYLSPESQVWMSHSDSILALPDQYQVLATTDSIPVAAFGNTNGKFPVYGLQFHPEVYHTTEGGQILSNFLFEICGCKGDWSPESFIPETVGQIQTKTENDAVVMGLSGGVDSSVAALLIHKAIGERLYCLFINNGLLRKDEYEQVLHSYKDLGLNVKGVDASDAFLTPLMGVTEPEQKRKIIGRVFIEVFEAEANKLEGVKWLGQGTIYPDVIESVSVHGPSVTIKSHHNVGGLPERMGLQLLEPLRLLFKDEVRKVGAALHLPAQILQRHPFPGPGLAIRILGEITAERVRILQEADSIFTNGLKEYSLYDDVWQAGVILLPVKSVGVMGDERTYEHVVALRAVTSTDGMTADWCHLPYEFLAYISNEIINRVKGINRVVYDISSKPPATIEWE